VAGAASAEEAPPPHEANEPAPSARTPRSSMRRRSGLSGWSWSSMRIGGWPAATRVVSGQRASAMFQDLTARVDQARSRTAARGRTGWVSAVAGAP